MTTTQTWTYGPEVNPPPPGMPPVISNDLADHIPEQTAARLRALRSHVADLRAALDASTDQKEEARLAVQELRVRLQVLTDHGASSRAGAGGAVLPSEHPSVVNAKRRLEQALKSYERATDTYNTRVIRWQNANTLLKATEDWLKDNRRKEIVAYTSPLPKFTSADQVRSKIEKLKADLEAVRNAPIPAAAIKARIREQIEELAKPPRLDKAGNIGWPQTSHPLLNLSGHASVSGAGPAPLSGFAAGMDTNLLGLMIWLNKDAIISMLERQISPDDKNALSADERAKRGADLESQILVLERAEVKLVGIDGVTARRLHDEARERRIWWFLSVLFLALGINKQLDLQTALTEAGRVLAGLQGWYAKRRFVQLGFIVVVAIVCTITTITLLTWARNTPLPTWIAMIGVTLVIGFVLMRAASFHHIDRFIHTAVLGLRWNWILEMGGIGMVLVASHWRRRGLKAA